MTVDLSIIIPLFNEEQNIRPLIERLRKVGEQFDFPYECILVDDGSTDKTSEMIRGEIESLSGFHMISYRGNKGKSKAYTLGFNHAKGRLLATMDGDLQDDPMDLLKMKEALTNEWDFIVGWKSTGKSGFLKSVYSKVFNSVVKFSSGLNVHDINCPLRLFRKECAEEISLKGDFFRYIPLLVAWKGYQVREVKVQNLERMHGESKYFANRYFQAFFDLFTLLFLNRYSEKPMHFFGGIGVGLFGVGFVIDIVLTLNGLLGHRCYWAFCNVIVWCVLDVIRCASVVVWFFVFFD